jgi:hypothetical protein
MLTRATGPTISPDWALDDHVPSALGLAVVPECERLGCERGLALEPVGRGEYADVLPTR